ncbi:MAG TPA: hypothetical protein VMF13_02945, partial [Luteitalea sp.]|nr:hypothetical protein [Luteitalea sp.]
MTRTMLRSGIGSAALGLLLTTAAWTPVHAQAAATAAAPARDYLEVPDNDDGLPGRGPVRRYAWFRKLWHDKRTAWAAQREQDQGAVVLLGDSITQGWNDRLATAFPG